MNLNPVIEAARKHLGGKMESSARLCLQDAIRHRDADDPDWDMAASRALKSLAYSVGICSPIYAKAWRQIHGDKPVGTW